MSDPEIIGPGDIYMEPRRGLGPLAKLFAVTAIAAGVVALAGVVWFAYNQGIRSGAEDAAPVIAASQDPIKRQPADRGGLDVPHQDKLVFGRLAPGQIEEPVERLLQPPEEPAERPPAPVVETASDEATPPSDAPVETVVVEPPVVSTVESQGTEPEPAPVVTVTPEPVVTAPPPPPPAPPVVAVTPPAAPPATATPTTTPVATPAAPPASAPKPPVTLAADAWRIQLAAVSSRDRALAEWDRIKKRNTDLLGTLDLNVLSVKLDRGTFFRIQAGPLTDRAAASSLCGKLKSRNQDCLIVAP
ncbi:MAG: SPOR domain-containing protein [Alphaproteobacteria bacterium]